MNTNIDHDMSSHEPQAQATESISESKTFTIRLPKPSTGGAELLILSFLIVVGVLQTVQLFALQQTAASVRVSPATASTPASSGGSTGADLPGMVGGC